MIRLGLLNVTKLSYQQGSKCQLQPIIVKALNLQAKPTAFECIRTTTFFNRVSAEAIWKSNNTVSNAGKRRGRGNVLKKKKPISLDAGLKLGCGKENMRWPGLNSPIMQGQDVLQLEKLAPDPQYESKIMAARNMIEKKKIQRIHPLERGWSGRSVLGKSFGPPAVIENNKGFDSYVLETKYLNLTHSKLGKIKSLAAFVAVGNQNGLIGISSAKASDLKGAINRAITKASKKLFRIKLEDGHTINHDFFYQYGITKLFAYKKPPGYGLVCNRGIAVCCKLIGIKDLYAKVEGSTNKQRVIKAFLLGLLEQKTYQQMADENKLHLVEQRRETYNFPTVKASPAEVLEEKDEFLQFRQYVMGNRLVLKKEKTPVLAFPLTYGKYLKRMHYQRNHKQVKLRLMAESGCCESYLTKIYPECRAPYLDGIKVKENSSTES